MSPTLRTLTKPEVEAACIALMLGMESGGYWGPAMVGKPPAEKCAWALRHLHAQVGFTSGAAFNLEEALGWVEEIVASMAMEGCNEAQ